MESTQLSISQRGLTKVLDAIESSSLDARVISQASSVITENQKRLNGMFESLHFKAPSAYEEWCDDITRQAMSLITPTLLEAKVPVELGQHLYTSIYGAVMSI